MNKLYLIGGLAVAGLAVWLITKPKPWYPMPPLTSKIPAANDQYHVWIWTEEETWQLRTISDLKNMFGVDANPAYWYYFVQVSSGVSIQQGGTVLSKL